MVVVLVIGILLAIAIPTFLGTSGSANDRAAQSDLSNGLTEASAVYQSESQSYTGVSAALVTSAPEFSWVSSHHRPVSGSNQISIYPVDLSMSGDARGVILAGLSKAGTCWWAAQLTTAPQVVAGTGFETSATAGSAGYESGAAAAGTFYAMQANSAHCYAKYAEIDRAGFHWGPTYQSAGAN